MKISLCLLVLCVGTLFAVKSEIDIGNFTAKSVRLKNGKYSGINIYDKQSGKLKQEIKGEHVSCNHEPYILGGSTGSELQNFVYFCDLGYVPETFFYNDENGEFFSNEVAFGGDANELLETKNHLIILSYPYSNEVEQQNAIISIFDKTSKKFIQVFRDIESQCNFLYADTGDDKEKEFDMKCLENGDYNFDGIEDFSLFRQFYSAGNTDNFYYLYDPKKKEFFLSDISGMNLEFDYKNKIIIETDRCCSGSLMQVTKHKIAENKMTKIETRCYKYENWEGEDYSEYDCGISIFRQFYLTSVGLKKNFEIRIRIIDENFARGEVKYKGQKESMQLKLVQKSDEKLVFDEFYQGNTSGTYTLNMNEGEITSAYYIRKDGKKFDLGIAGDYY
ncbi:MAG: hypothetical protein LBG21_02600 [Campylobacteraceae bacterium]|jgi:hypothetical protein|nr:hypothetical protein [Campylobacteraceae bacterium]